MNFNEYWAVIGDFNLVTGAHEKTGQLHLRISCLNFLNAIKGPSLLQIETKFSFFTWSQRSVRGFYENKMD